MTTTEVDRERGRPSKLTPENLKKICRFIINLNSVEDALALVGIERSTGMKWLQAGRKFAANPRRKRDPRAQALIDFFYAVEEAKAQSVALLTAVVAKDARKDGKMALRVLRARKPFEWGGVRRVEDVTPVGKYNARTKLLDRLAKIEARVAPATVSADDTGREPNRLTEPLDETRLLNG